jgi:hypothetical protein
MEAAGLDGLPVAPDADRIDLVAGPFTDPTSITNPLFPIGDLRSAVLNGHVDGLPFRTETTLLPHTRIIEWTDGQCVEAVVSQHTAYLGGRLEEVALDYYAQADDGSVWYFGEDVLNYDTRGEITDTEGTWLAGKEGPAAMIMPGIPQIGDVNRPENIPGLVFEEVSAKLIDETVNGPSGPVNGVFVAEELHDDRSFSDKVFAPGYGEFLSAHDGDLEKMAVASPMPAGSWSTMVTLSIGPLTTARSSVKSTVAPRRTVSDALLDFSMLIAWTLTVVESQTSSSFWSASTQPRLVRLPDASSSTVASYSNVWTPAARLPTVHVRSCPSAEKPADGSAVPAT